MEVFFMPKIKKRGSVAKKRRERDIVNVANSFTEFFTRYKKQFIAAGAALAAVLIIVAGYRLIQNRRDRQAAPLVSAAYVYYDGSDTVKPDYAKALELFRDIQQRYSGTMNGAISQYYVGNCLVNLGRDDEAIKEYETFVKKYSGDKFLLGLVYQRLGYVYQSLGKQADAIKAFEQSEKADGPGAATYELARLYEASGNIPESLKKYKEVLDHFPGTSWALEAMGKVQKIAPPAPSAAKKMDK
jgi:tetratricopeptide (TPR) repeat protein